MKRSPTRRRYLQCTALASLLGTAGCLSTARRGQSNDEIEAVQSSPEATGTAAAETRTGDESSASIEEWLADANGYDGERVRFGQRARPTIHVGHRVEDGLSFSPVVVEVPPMTDVRWDWTGHGGQQNVVALDGTFDSGRTNAQPGTGYHYYFEETGTYRYVSEPHRDEGMKGAIVVSEPPSTGNERVDEWLAVSGNFDGAIVDETGSETASVRVGTPGNGGDFAFDPPVLKVSTGTTVSWQWTGNGGVHNVVFEDLDVASDGLSGDPDATFEHTFDRPGTHRYACAPHERLGMRGVVIVVRE